MDDLVYDISLVRTRSKSLELMLHYVGTKFLESAKIKKNRVVINFVTCKNQESSLTKVYEKHS
jgi:hypothetical protein